jgi:galactan endo-1,6-beta-galactosidase
MRRRTLLAAAAGAAVGATAMPATASADYTTTINPGTGWGTWEGWGTSLAWWAGVFGNRDDLADALFTTNSVPFGGASLPGLGLNIVRYNAGASSWNSIGGQSMVASPHIPRFKQMEGYWLDWQSSDPGSASWNWSVDAAQRSMVGKARDRGANLFELFSNSPMWWMCNNHNPSGAADGSNNLQSWNYRQHAVYLATIARYARDHWGVNFTSVEALNEPSSGWWKADGTQEGCHVDAAIQQTVITDLRSELDARGLTGTMVSASDETSYDLALSTWTALGSAQGSVGRINVHGYQYGGGRRDLLYAAARNAGKKLWNSEYGDGNASGLSLASNLNLDLRWLHPTAWVYWQALDIPGWGLIEADNGVATLGGVATKYFVLAQYSRHIRPGMQIIDGGEGNTVAAYDPSARRLVIVTTNYGTGQWINFDLSRFGTVTGGAGGLVQRWATDTGGGGDRYTYHADTYLHGSVFWSWFSPNTVQTFQIDNVVR